MIVAFTVHNRPAYLRETLESWSRVRGISMCTLLFQCEPGCDESVQACREADFARTVILRNQARQGVLANPHRALSNAFDLAENDAFQQAANVQINDFVILAEEDLIVSPDVLEFFTWCQRYADDPQVLGVTTYQHDEQPGGLSGIGPADWSRDDRWHFWVWGTWRDRWENLLRDNWDTTYRGDCGCPPHMRGWDWFYRNHLIRHRGMKMIAPSLCRSQHIGEYGGAHCQPQDFERLLSPSFAGLDVPPQDYREVS